MSDRLQLPPCFMPKCYVCPDCKYVGSAGESWRYPGSETAPCMGCGRTLADDNVYVFGPETDPNEPRVPLSEVREALQGEAENFENVRFLAEQESLQYGMKGEHLGEHEAKGIAVTARNARNAFKRVAAAFPTDSERGERK